MAPGGWPLTRSTRGGLAPRRGGWEHSGLPGPPGAAGSQRRERRGRGRGGNGKRGQPAAQDTRVEKQSQQFPMEQAAAPPGLQAGRGLGPAWWAVGAAPREGPQGSLGRPGLLTVHPSSPEHTGPASPLPPPPPSPPPGERVLCSPELLATARGPLQMCTAGPGLPRPRWMGGRGLPAGRRWQGQGTCWEPEGQEGQWRRGLARPPSPQAASAAKDLVYSQETRLPASREKAFLQGPAGTELASASTSRVNQKHVDTLPDTKPCPAPFLPQLDPGDLNLTQPQELGNRGNLLICPLRLRGDGFWGGWPGPAPTWARHLTVGLPLSPAGQSWGWSPPPPASAEAPPAAFRAGSWGLGAGREWQAVLEGRSPSSSSYQGRGGPDATVY